MPWLVAFFLGGREENSDVFNAPAFQRAAQETGVYLTSSGGTKGTGTMPMPGHCREERRMVGGMLWMAWLSMIRKKHKPWGFSHRRKRKEWRMYPASQLFKGLTEGMISVLAQDDDKEQAWIPGGHGEQGRAGKLVAKEQENINAAGRHQREWDYELLKNNPSASN